MPRILHQFAVVVPRVLEHLRAAAATGSSPATLERFVRQEQDAIAYYGIVWDGWGDSRELLHEVLRRSRVDLSPLESAGLLILPPEVPLAAATVEEVLSRVRDGPGLYASRQCAAVLHSLIGFRLSTQCPAVVVSEVLGPSYDDREFRGALPHPT